MKNKILSKVSLQNGLKVFTLIFFIVAVIVARNDKPHLSPKKIKIYWFIPDGLRADRGQFNIYQWAQLGELPNLRKLMARGSYGYSRPVFPGHTPTNYATLLTGVYPDKHGVADGAMRTFGYPLKMVSKGGFSSLSKQVAPIWTELEEQNYLVSLQSVPGSTPPEIFKGNVIKGRWGGWGIEFPAMIIESTNSNSEAYKAIGNNRRVFTFGPEMTVYVSDKKNKNFEFDAWGQKFFVENADNHKLLIKANNNKLNLSLQEGQWSDWTSVPLKYELKNDYQMNSPKKTDWENELSAIELDVMIKMKLIALDDKGHFRLRIIFDSLNEFVTYPSELSQKIEDKLGPMTDFVDNYPPQLVYHPKDKDTFLEESELSWNWHKKIIPFLMKDLKSDFVIHSIYNPNQMLTSRWWLPFIDNESEFSNHVSLEEKNQLWSEVKHMYKQMDDMLGEIINNADENTYIILSSDHGVIPLNKEVRINNFFAKKGWLTYFYNTKTQSYEIDWKKTKVIFLQMNNVYINPNGLDGPYQPQNSNEYKKLKEEVMKELATLRDDKSGKRILSFVLPREDVMKIHMPKDRVGDLVISPLQGFSWVEDVSEDGEILTNSLKGGYKQGLDPENIEGLLTPFVIAGPGIKSNFKIEKVLKHVDQYATIAKLTKIKHPTKPVIDGRVIEEIFNSME